MSATFPEALRALLTARAYPHPVESVQLIETHISWVVLAGAFAYKIKRPVRFEFIDLRAADRRRFLCEEELRLNRRFAPQLYLEVCPIVSVNGEARIGAQGPVLEHAVKMRRFKRSDELDRLLGSWRIEPAELESFGRELAMLHARAPAAELASSWGRPGEIQELMLRNLGECAQASAVFGSTDAVVALRSALERRLEAARSWMITRRAAGRIRECHGDLHCRNVVRMDSHLVAFDCLEFDPALRWIDVADEVALLSGDLLARSRPLHAQAFLGGYFAESGDYQACRVLRLYQAHRALVRAKVTALAAAGQGDEGKQRPLQGEYGRLLGCAREFLSTHSPGPVLILMSGLSGSGKTWLARQLAPRLSAIHLRSDVERKRRAGLADLKSSHSRVGEGLYTPERTEALYDHLAGAAENVLAGGYTVIVDATFLRRAQRARFATLAARLKIPLRLVLCEAPAWVLQARLAERAVGHLDASEADHAVLEWQCENFELPSAQEGIDTIRVDSAQSNALQRVVEHVCREGAA